MARPKKLPKGVTSKTVNGVKYWYVSLDGKRQCCGKGDVGRDIAIAAKAKETAKKYENKEVNAGLKVKRYQVKTFRQLSNWYMLLPNVQGQKMYPRKVSIAKHLLDYFGDRPVSQIEADDIERYRELRLKQDVSNGTIDLKVQVLRTMFNSAIRRKKIPPDAKPGEFLQVREANPRRLVTDDEYGRLLEHADAELRDLLICGYETGMRAGEICRHTAEKVKLNLRHISGALLNYIDLGVFDTKTKAQRTVPISAEIKKVLKRRLDGLGPDDLVFTWGGGRAFRASYLGEKLKPLCDLAGIVYGDKVFNDKGEHIGLTFHCFRHTRTTRWVEAGYSDEIIRRATGHKTLDAYRNYIKLDPSVVVRLVEDKKGFSDKPDKNRIKSPQSL